MPAFRLDIYAWIPQADVPNPLHGLPGGAARWGPGACGPRFGGDNFVTPAPTYASWAGSYRAMQTLAFGASPFGSAPLVTINTGVKPGLTTVLTAPRAAGGTICHSLTPTITKSAASVSWSLSDLWYEARMHGSAHDPVPAAAASHLLGSFGARVGAALTPDLEWDACVRFQSGARIPAATRARYSISSGFTLDVASGKFPSPTHFGGTANVVHGIIMVRRFPSYVVYATIDNGRPTTIPIYLADASGRSLAEIVVGQHDPIRQLTW